MPPRSYLQRIAGTAHGVTVLSPPRVLFRPAALPMEGKSGMQMRTAMPAPAPAPSVTPAVESETASRALAAPPAGDPDSRGPPRPTLTPEASAQSARPVPPTAAAELQPRLPLIIPSEPPSRPVEGAPPAISVPSVEKQRSGVADSPSPHAPKAAPAPIPHSETRSKQPAPLTGPALSEPPAAEVRLPVMDGVTDVQPLPMRSGVDVAQVATSRPTASVDRPRIGAHDSTPIRLEPPPVAAPLHRPDSRERDARVRIGSLEVRIVPPTAGQASAGHPPAAAIPPARPAPPARIVTPLSRGFRPFGLVQG